MDDVFECISNAECISSQECIPKSICCYNTYNAVLNDHFNCLKYLHENGHSWDESTCDCAARKGHLDCLKYSHENGALWSEKTCEYAARYGHLDCLKYAHENGCPWDGWTCTCATIYSHMHCLIYARENGAPCDMWTYYYARENSNCEYQNYIIGNKRPDYEKYGKLYNSYIIITIDEIVRVTSLDFIRYPLNDLMLI